MQGCGSPPVLPALVDADWNFLGTMIINLLPGLQTSRKGEIQADLVSSAQTLKARINNFLVNVYFSQKIG